jgi:hypothetical protein
MQQHVRARCSVVTAVTRIVLRPAYKVWGLNLFKLSPPHTHARKCYCSTCSRGSLQCFSTRPLASKQPRIDGQESEHCGHDAAYQASAMARDNAHPDSVGPSTSTMGVCQIHIHKLKPTSRKPQPPSDHCNTHANTNYTHTRQPQRHQTAVTCLTQRSSSWVQNMHPLCLWCHTL